MKNTKNTMEQIKESLQGKTASYKDSFKNNDNETNKILKLINEEKKIAKIKTQLDYIIENKMRLSYSVFTRAVYEGNITDSFFTVIEELMEIYICEGKGEEQKFLMKIYDHIHLAMEQKQLMENIKSEIYPMIIEPSVKEIIKGSEEKIDKDIKSAKFDTIGVLTLVITAFTMLSVNATILAGLLGNKECLSNSKMILTIVPIINITIILSVFSIYSIIRKIHGDIKDDWYLNLIIIGVLVLLVIVIIIVWNLPFFEGLIF